MGGYKAYHRHHQQLAGYQYLREKALGKIHLRALRRPAEHTHGNQGEEAVAQDEFYCLVLLEEVGNSVECIDKVVHPLKKDFLARISLLSVWNISLMLGQTRCGVGIKLVHRPRGDYVLRYYKRRRDEEEHLDGRKIRRLPAFEIIANHLARAVDEMPQRARQAAVSKPPDLQSLAQRMPEREAADGGRLSATRTKVACVRGMAVQALVTVLREGRSLYAFALPFGEARRTYTAPTPRSRGNHGYLFERILHV